MKEKDTTGTFNHIRWEKDGRTGILTLNRPPSNEMTGGFFRELGELVNTAASDPDLNGIMVRGEGRHFSSGAALDELLGRIGTEDTPGDETGGIPRFLGRNYLSMLFFEEAEIPVVAAIRGVCLGSAFEFALLCHVRICSEDAVFGLPETTFNLIPGLGGIRRIAELAGKANALELVLRGRTFSAGEALELGLVDAIVPKKELYGRSLSLIGRLSSGYRKEKRMLYLKRYFPKDVAVEDQSV